MYRRHVAAIWEWAYHRLGTNRDAADDLTSSVFFAAIGSLERFDPRRSTIEGWLYGIARHKLADHLRKLYRTRKFQLTLAQHATVDAEPDDPVVADEQAAAVNCTMAQLSIQERQAMAWKYCDRLSTRQIAQRLGRTEKAVENLLYRAKNRFKQFYKKHSTTDFAVASNHRVGPAEKS